jgi:NAD dependent epimerase/dehydratase family enzyme
MVLEGQKVLPEKLLEAGYSFKYPKLEDALKELLKK